MICFGKARADDSPEGTLKTDSPIYEQGETVTFIWKIRSTDWDVISPRLIIYDPTDGWTIRDISYGSIVISPDPSIELSWDQKDDGGEQVSPGKYGAYCFKNGRVNPPKLPYLPTCRFTTTDAAEEMIAPSWKLVHFGQGNGTNMLRLIEQQNKYAKVLR